MYMEQTKMKIIEKFVDALTGEETITERDETAAEKKTRETFEKEIAKFQAEAETKAKARQAIADRLGLTADELKVLLG
jgi:hypothetical protein